MGTDGEARGFEGKVAVITGGTQGLGEGVARLFAARGAVGLAICGRNAERGEAIAAELSEAGTKTIFVPADLQNIADGRAVIDQAEKTFGRLDSLVNCAAATDRGSIETTTEEIWDKLFDMNVKIQFFMSQRAIEVMRRHKIPGTIVNIGTIVAHGGPPFLIPYSSSKGALMTMTRAVANAVKRDRIRINTLNIGWTNTPREHIVQTQVHARPENWLEIASAAQPFGRLIEIDDVARAVAFMASEESGLLTGAVIDFDQTIIGTLEENPGM
ncbi:MAG: SDR family oxidoreductase [Alphaproteobacteria bacterium]|nr:SDR family oxidoreductase [Alphaproteobacteria bacterium]